MITEPLLTIITDSRYFDHDTGGNDHPESPVRLEVIIDSLHQSDFVSLLNFVSTEPASRADLMHVHDEDWLFRFEEAVLSGKEFVDHQDNQISYDSFTVAALAAGAGMKGVDLIETGKQKQVLCLVRPPGHHAEKNKPFGCCFYNNVLVAVRYWQQKYKKKRVAVFDFDAHHGNGIQSGLEREVDSLYISIHEHPSFSYPGTGYRDEIGLGMGKGTVLNIPLSPGAGDREVRAVIRNKIEPKLEQWQPDSLVVAAGFDGHVQDDMSGLAYSTELYKDIGNSIQGWANKYTEGRVLSILEGGYELPVLGESVEAYVAGLLQLDVKEKK